MATTLSAVSSANFEIRWKTDFATRALNARNAGILAPGIYRGFGLYQGAAANQFRVRVDPLTNESASIIQDANGIQISVRFAAEVVLDLSALANDSYYLALYANYTIGSSTVVEWRAYTQAELDAAVETPTLVILGKVSKTGGIPVASDISFVRRTAAVLKSAMGSAPWIQMIPDPHFEQFSSVETDPTLTWKEWRIEIIGTGTADSVATVSADPDFTVGARHLRVTMSGTVNPEFISVTTGVPGFSAPGSVTDLLPVVPGRRANLRLVSKTAVAFTNLTAEIRVKFYDASQAQIGGLTQTLAIPTALGWSVTDLSFEIPSTIRGFSDNTPWCSVEVFTQATAGVGVTGEFYIDQLSLLMEDDVFGGQAKEFFRALRGSGLMLQAKTEIEKWASWPQVLGGIPKLFLQLVSSAVDGLLELGENVLNKHISTIVHGYLATKQGLVLGSAPAQDVSALYDTNVPKAWAVVNGGALTFLDGFNVDTVTQPGGPGTAYIVTLKTALKVGMTPCAVATPFTGSNYLATVPGATNAAITVFIQDTAGVGQNDNFFLIVFGRSTSEE